MEAETTIPRIEPPAGFEKGNDDLQRFVDLAMSEIENYLSKNMEQAKTFTDVEETVQEVLANHNTRSLEVRARPLENPRVTLWLKDCPLWAKDSWETHIFPWASHTYNGKVTVTVEVRPF